MTEQKKAQLTQMTCVKEIFAGIKSCFSLTSSERLVILLILAIFLMGLGLRWRHLSREQPDGYEQQKSEINSSRK